MLGGFFILNQVVLLLMFAMSSIATLVPDETTWIAMHYFSRCERTRANAHSLFLSTAEPDIYMWFDRLHASSPAFLSSGCFDLNTSVKVPQNKTAFARSNLLNCCRVPRSLARLNSLANFAPAVQPLPPS